jgi:hypothetical protein
MTGDNGTEWFAPDEGPLSLPEDQSDVNIVGYIDEANRFFVTGWVADRDDWTRSLRVDILVNDTPVGCAQADTFRAGLTNLAPEATGRYEFRYYFADPLSLYQENKVSVRVSETKAQLANSSRPLPAAPSDPEAQRGRPSGPILVSTCGRTGSTVIMAELARHPNVVVAGDRPYEVEMGCYYAYALRTLSAHGDPMRSLTGDRITASENRYHIGFNPYFEQSNAKIFKDRRCLDQFVSERVPPRLAHAFRAIILDFYQDVAADQDIEFPIFFAEKSLPERDSRLGIRYMFPNLREIVLVRDFRDIVCSSMATKNANFEVIFNDVLAAAHMFRGILDAGTDGLLVLRYEDYVADKQATLGRLFGYLGLGVPGSGEGALKDLFDVHATSTSPEASIGRWRRDLTPEQQARCDVFAPFLERLGYEV